MSEREKQLIEDLYSDGHRREKATATMIVGLKGWADRFAKEFNVRPLTAADLVQGAMEVLFKYINQHPKESLQYPYAYCQAAMKHLAMRMETRTKKRFFDASNMDDEVLDSVLEQMKETSHDKLKSMELKESKRMLKELKGLTPAKCQKTFRFRFKDNLLHKVIYKLLNFKNEQVSRNHLEKCLSLIRGFLEKNPWMQNHLRELIGEYYD